MMKVTENGIETLGSPIELSEEDLEFINDMFQKFSDHQKHPLYKEDKKPDA